MPMPVAAETLSWRPGPIRAVLPIVVHSVAAAAVVCVALAYGWAWTLGGVVLCSAIREIRILRRERGRTHTLTLHGRLVTFDGGIVEIERGWLGPGLTVVWLRDGKRRERVSVFRSELDGAGHAALRRHLRGIDFGQ